MFNKMILIAKKSLKRNDTIKTIGRRIIHFFRRNDTRKYSAYLEKSYKYIIEKHRNYIPIVGGDKVWVCWWQGEENMPEIVKICYSSLLKNANGHKVNLITFENYKDFVEFPDYIIEKHKKGMISNTHLSDILRICLLEKYGGLWIDATYYLTALLPVFESNIKIWMGKWQEERGKVFSFQENLIYSIPDNPFCLIIKKLFFEYWKFENKLIHYFLIDCFMHLAYTKSTFVQNLINEHCPDTSGITALRDLLIQNKQYNDYEFKKICAKISFHKLTWKDVFYKYKNDKLTYYGYLYNNWVKLKQ